MKNEQFDSDPLDLPGNRTGPVACHAIPSRPRLNRREGDARKKVLYQIFAVKDGLATSQNRSLDAAPAYVDKKPISRVASMNTLFNAISGIDTVWFTLAHQGMFPGDEDGIGLITQLYREWGEAGWALLSSLETHSIPPAESIGIEQLKDNLDEVRGILTPDDEFFDGASLLPFQLAADEAYRNGETAEFEEMGD